MAFRRCSDKALGMVPLVVPDAAGYSHYYNRHENNESG
jgi:hypothetical protein